MHIFSVNVAWRITHPTRSMEKGDEFSQYRDIIFLVCRFASKPGRKAVVTFSWPGRFITSRRFLGSANLPVNFSSMTSRTAVMLGENSLPELKISSMWAKSPRRARRTGKNRSGHSPDVLSEAYCKGIGRPVSRSRIVPGMAWLESIEARISSRNFAARSESWVVLSPHEGHVWARRPSARPWPTMSSCLWTSCQIFDFHDGGMLNSLRRKSGVDCRKG